MYPGTGVCKITDIVTQKFMRTEEKTYYVLKAVYDTANTTIYCPVDNDRIKLRKLLSHEDFEQIITTLDLSESIWVNNDTERKKVFAATVSGGNHAELLRLITELHMHREQKQKEGKKLHLADERVLHDAEKIICQELAYSMDSDTAAASQYVKEKILQLIC